MPEPVLTGPTVADALGDAVRRLAVPEIADPRREARALWAAVAGGGVTAGAVWLARPRAASLDLLERFHDAVAQRAAGVPFAYAVGRASFRTLDLNVDRRALIPRPETEGLVDLVLEWAGSGARAPGPGPRGIAADIGTGCGCIALSLAVEGDFARVIAVERSRDAAQLARENVALVRPQAPVEVREGDLLAPLVGERCRVIVANPPYLTASEYADLDPAVRLFEPREALVSGADGLDATRSLLAGARRLLARGGLLALEIDERRAGRVRTLALDLGWNRATEYDDLFGRPRYLLASLEEDT